MKKKFSISNDKIISLSQQREKLAEELSNKKLKNIVELKISTHFPINHSVSKMFCVYDVKLNKSYVCNIKTDLLINHIVKSYKDIIHNISIEDGTYENWKLIKLFLKYE